MSTDTTTAVGAGNTLPPTEWATEHVVVPFAGEGSGDEPLTWAQRELWAVIIRQRSWMPLGEPNPLPPGTTVDDVAGVLRHLMSRHQSLRTRLRYDADGSLRQVVVASGEAWLEVVDAGDDDPEQIAEEIKHHYQRIPLDHVEQWPIRMAVIRRHGVPTHQVTIIAHLAIDASGGAVMLADLASGTDAPVVGRQGLDQARWQRSPAGVRQHESSMRHWEKGMLRIPPLDDAARGHRYEPRHWQGQSTSTALFLAVRAIVAQTGADSGHVLIALYAAAYGRRTGRGVVALRPLVNNRFRREFSDVVGLLIQNGLCVVDVGDVPFVEVLDRVRRATLAAYKHAYYDPAGLRELIATIDAVHGPVLDAACFFNDRRTVHRDITGIPVPTPEQIRAALPASTLKWGGGRDIPYETAMLHVEDVPGEISLLFQVDTHCMSVPDMQACIRGMEAIAVEVACGGPA
jgi:hypothetical protein